MNPKLDTFTVNSLRSYLYHRNPTDIPDEEVAEEVLTWLEEQPEEIDYWLNRGWFATIAACLRLT